MDTSFQVRLTPGYDRRVNMFYMKTNVELQDSIIPLFTDPKHKETFMFDKLYQYDIPFDKNATVEHLHTMYLRVSPSTRTY